MTQLQFAEMALPRRRPKISHAHTAGEIGMDRAADTAERTSPGWTAAALEKVRAFARNQAGLFTVEQMRWIIEQDLPTPTGLRAWGVLARMALKHGFIEKTGRSAPTYSSNGSDRPLYKRGGKA